MTRYQAVCDMGCGECSVSLVPFELYREEDLDHNLIQSVVEPIAVSSCCRAPVHVYDTLGDTWTDYKISVTKD